MYYLKINDAKVTLIFEYSKRLMNFLLISVQLVCKLNFYF